MDHPSSIPRWPGYITTNEYMTFDQLVEWEALARTLSSINDENPDLSHVRAALPVMCKIVLAWHITGLPEPVTPETFPGSAPLLKWLLDIVNQLFEKTNSVDPI